MKEYQKKRSNHGVTMRVLYLLQDIRLAFGYLTEIARENHHL